MSADCEMGVGGFLVGALAGASIAAARDTGQAITQAAQRQRDLGTVWRWQIALKKSRRETEMARRVAVLLRRENDQLRNRLQAAELELDILRRASAA